MHLKAFPRHVAPLLPLPFHPLGSKESLMRDHYTFSCLVLPNAKPAGLEMRVLRNDSCSSMSWSSVKSEYWGLTGDRNVQQLQGQTHRFQSFLCPSGKG